MTETPDIKSREFNSVYAHKGEHVAMQYINRTAKLDILPGTEDILCEIHKRILQPLVPDDLKETVGVYRSSNVVLNSIPFNVPDAKTIYVEMRQLGQEIDLKAALLKKGPENIGSFVEFLSYAHCEVVRRQPFPDGNKRTARLYINLMCKRLGYKPLVIGPMHSPEYTSAMKNYATRGSLIEFRILLNNIFIETYSRNDANENLPYLYQLHRNIKNLHDKLLLDNGLVI